MAVRSPDELRTALTGLLGDSPADDGVALLEDLTDTLANLTANGSAADWEQKYRENDAAWRKRYIDRFNDPVDGADTPQKKDNNNSKPMTFEDLFKEV